MLNQAKVQNISPLKVERQSGSTSSFTTAMGIIEHEFPIEFLVAGELAQLETFAIPSISKLLHQTAQYEKAGLKRLDDTRVTMYGIFLNPKDSKERQVMVDHLNWIHSHYDISNDDSLYTILRMFFHPVEWIQHWGWRQLTQSEIDALTAEMVNIGKALGVVFETESFDELYQWQARYREQKQCYSPANKAVTLGAIKGVQAHFPRWIHPVIPGVIRSLMPDPDLLNALGLKPANKIQSSLAKGAIYAWKNLNKVYRPWRKTPFSESWFANYYPSYDDNRADCCQLGPAKLIKHRNKQGGCPFH